MPYITARIAAHHFPADPPPHDRLMSVLPVGRCHTGPSPAEMKPWTRACRAPQVEGATCSKPMLRLAVYHDFASCNPLALKDESDFPVCLQLAELAVKAAKPPSPQRGFGSADSGYLGRRKPGEQVKQVLVWQSSGRLTSPGARSRSAGKSAALRSHPLGKEPAVSVAFNTRCVRKWSAGRHSVVRKRRLSLRAATDDDEDDEHGAPPGEYASPEEARAAISALNDADHAKLMLVAAIHWRQRRLRDRMTPQELLSEAILRTLLPAGRRRRWRKSVVSIVEHLDRTMESVSGHVVAAAVTEAAVLDAIAAEDLDARTNTPRRFHRADAEVQLLAREQLDEIRRLFTGAQSAFDLLSLRAEGYNESETTERLGMDKRAYEAARKKAERVIAKFALGSERREEP